MDPNTCLSSCCHHLKFGKYFNIHEKTRHSIRLALIEYRKDPKDPQRKMAHVLIIYHYLSANVCHVIFARDLFLLGSNTDDKLVTIAMIYRFDSPLLTCAVHEVNATEIG